MNKSSPTCPQCGVNLPETSPQGFCARCLVSTALLHPTDPAPQTPKPEDLKWLADSFPQLVIEEMVGSGGMGRVYKARQPHLNRTVALKVLSPTSAANPEWLERFTREARALARLSHPHIVQVYDFGESPMPYLLMEFVEGVNLRQAMESGGLSAREALTIVPKLCDALHYAHERGVLHRDIKPENILIDTEGRVKLVDFGLAKLRDDGTPSFTLTQSGAKLGTLAYMAPEQVEKPHEVDHRADIYSLGVVLYEMLTGGLPLGRFPSPSEASGVDSRLDEVVFRTLEKHKERRFQTADDLRTGLQSACEGPPPPPRAYEWNRLDFDYRTATQFLGLPLLHLAFGKDPLTGRQRRARGIVAIGGHATGVLALGVFARGLFAWGVISVGLVSGGVLSLGLLASFGVASLSLIFSYGVVSVALYALGVTSIGYLAAGVRAYGLHTASTDGPVDPQAAAFGDAWLNPLMQGYMAANAIFLTVIMIAGIWAGYTSHANQGHKAAGLRLALLYALLALIGPASYLISSTTRTAPPSFAKRIKAAAAERLTDAKRESRARTSKAAELAAPLVVQASRTDSASARDAAVKGMITVLQSQDETRILAGLYATTRISQVRTDKSGLRQAIRPLLLSTSPEIRAQAARSLVEADPESQDKLQVVAMIPSATQVEWGPLAFALGQIAKRDYTGEFGKPMLQLLEAALPTALEGSYSMIDVFQPLWGAKLSPEIERFVVEASYLQPSNTGIIGTAGIGYDAFYYALSTQANKSTESVKRLLELAEHPDSTNISGRCLWGLQGTVANPQDQATVSAAVLRLLESRNDGYLWRQGTGLLGRYAGKQDLPGLERLAAREALTPEQLAALQKILQTVAQRS